MREKRDNLSPRQESTIIYKNLQDSARINKNLQESARGCRNNLREAENYLQEYVRAFNALQEEANNYKMSKYDNFLQQISYESTINQSGAVGR